jgi:homocitrate synthase NifV
MEHVCVVDTTLRDGEQAPGVAFSSASKAEIAGLLSDAGVTEIEVGTPAMGDDEVDAIRRVARLGLRAPLIAWARAIDADIDIAARCDVPYVHISFPVSERHLGLKGWDPAHLLDELRRLVRLARTRFDGVSVGALDATRADPALLESFALAAVDAGARRLRLADTVGFAHPSGVETLISRLRTAAPDLELEFHGHDDLGMATANTVVAAVAGAGAVSVTVNGLGERAGNAALEEVVVALEVLELAETSVELSHLASLCERVAELSQRRISSWKPVVGPETFTHESGIHVAALQRDPRAFQPFLPSEVGAADAVFVVGKHSGTAGVREALAARGIDADKSTVARLLPEVRRLAQLKGQPLSAGEVEYLFRRVTENRPRHTPSPTVLHS